MKETYLIDIIKSETLITETFKTEINQINIVQKIATSLILKLKKTFLEKQSIRLEQKKIETNIKLITINLKNYTQKEYI